MTNPNPSNPPDYENQYKKIQKMRLSNAYYAEMLCLNTHFSSLINLITEQNRPVPTFKEASLVYLNLIKSGEKAKKLCEKINKDPKDLSDILDKADKAFSVLIKIANKYEKDDKQ